MTNRERYKDNLEIVYQDKYITFYYKPKHAKNSMAFVDFIINDAGKSLNDLIEEWYNKETKDILCWYEGE